MPFKHLHMIRRPFVTVALALGLLSVNLLAGLTPPQQNQVKDWLRLVKNPTKTTPVACRQPEGKATLQEVEACAKALVAG